jgi:hypothetical protein
MMLGRCKLKKAGILDWVPPGASGAITCVMAILRQLPKESDLFDEAKART